MPSLSSPSARGGQSVLVDAVSWLKSDWTAAFKGFPIASAKWRTTMMWCALSQLCGRSGGGAIYTTARAQQHGYNAPDHSRCHTRATRCAALRSHATVRRPASRAARTSSSTTWPALIASSRRARVRHQRREATSRASRCGRHTTARRATPHAVAAPIRNEPPTHERRTLTPRPTNHRRRLRALLLRLAQVHRQVRDAAHHAEAQVVAYKY